MMINNVLTLQDVLGLIESLYKNNAVQLGMQIVFSWVILMPIAVIVAGKFLIPFTTLRLESRSEQLFRVKIGETLRVEAKDDEVILGFAGFLVTLVLLALYMGHGVQELVEDSFGLAIHHFNALCMLSAFICTLWAFILSFILTISNKVQRAMKESQSRRHYDTINRLNGQ